MGERELLGGATAREGHSFEVNFDSWYIELVVANVKNLPLDCKEDKGSPLFKKVKLKSDI